ncbi:hypothetical protein [Ferviditalea candida]|uniref:50S ribosomal protein L33 n=1 Tax=Ferviditalea candida TaxID=3108399 RepID=A0ABU5ZKQ9_9BACL|nr:hypothetical protein [Paenibacillaceae bacterium T2]
MHQFPNRNEIRQLVGKKIYAVKKDGSVVTGTLQELKGNRLVLNGEGESAQTQAFTPLVLYDLLAIGLYANPGFGGFGGFGGGFGYPFFW